MDEKTIPLGNLPVNVKVQLSGGKKWGGHLDYRALFEQMKDCVFIIDLDFKFLAANPQALRLLGYEEYQLVGLPMGEIMPFRNPGEKDVLIENPSILTEHVLRKKDGSAIPVDLSISVVEDQENHPIYIQMLARDMSERKQAQLNLKRHTRALSVIGEVSARLFLYSDIQSSLPEVLESLCYSIGVFACAIFELTEASSILNYHWSDASVGNFKPQDILMPLASSIVREPEHVFSITDMSVEHPTLKKLSILSIPIRGVQKIWGYLVMFDKEQRLSWLPTEFDTVQTAANLIGAALERIQYEDALRLSEARNRVIVDAMPDLLLRVDLSGRILDYNDNPEHLLRSTNKPILGMTLGELWSEKLAQAIIGEENQAAFITSNQVKNIHLPNHENIYEARLYPIGLKEALIILRDITEQAHLDRMKSDFINRASHELRTPLTSAILMTELIKQGGTPEELDKYWRALTGELSRQKNLIDQLLTAGRLEGGTMQLAVQPMDLIPVLKESIQAVRPLADKSRIEVHLNNTQPSIHVLGDLSGLQQVFVNLINNAIKFSPANEHVAVSVKQTDTEAQVLISDHGLGIPPEAIPHLFSRFYRAENAAVAEIPGSGIGLYIVKSILEELGGTISVESKVKEGTTFTVNLSLVKSNQV